MIKRRCLGCNEIKNREEMIKLTKDYKTGEILINSDKFHFGRSIYLCKCETCINTAFKKDRISRNLKKFLSKEEKENIRTVLNSIIVVKQ